MSSHHTKHHLENLHPNIAVFRHPDHLPDSQGLTASITSSLENLSLDALNLGQMSVDAMKGVYGIHEGMILYWAHHEKLCIIDGTVSFMGGLDMCYGRWDTHQHSLADVHDNPNDIVFPGQDYNNARVLDFTDVAHPSQNKLDRTQTSRMGWSDVAVSFHGPAVEDIRRLFVERWNFLYDTKYQSRNDPRFSRLALHGHSSFGGHPAQQQQGPHHQAPYQSAQYQPGQSYSPSPQPAQSQPSWSQYQDGQQQPGLQSYSPAPPGVSELPPPSPQPGWNQQQGSYQYGQQSHPGAPQPPSQPYAGQNYSPPPPGPPPGQSAGQTQAPYFSPPPGQHPQEGQYSSSRGFSDDYSEDRGDRERAFGLGGTHGSGSGSGFVPRRFRDNFDSLRGELAGQIHQYQDRFTSGPLGRPLQRGNMSCQILRSCGKWSNGTPTEHSIADAYAEIIRHSEHFIYIENQFFITATSEQQAPVKNKIGAAIVERILRAARAGQKYKMIIVIPSVPCFAGDLGDDAALGTRAIMEFQYYSINRGGNSIMELIAKEGYNPMEYIRFYNLRNYDRLKYAVPHAPQGAGGFGPDHRSAFDTSAAYQPYSAPASGSKSGAGQWDSVSACYMLNGPDLRSIPWDGPSEAEINAFVTEELYVHSKVSSTVLSNFLTE